jgi:predicted O-methyltransferase YrrM
MLNEIFRLSDYFQYLLTARTRHGIHSPFVYSFTEQVINNRTPSPYFDIIETTRRKMIKSDVVIDFVDLGAGNKTGKRKVSEIASSTAKSAKYGRFLFRLLAAAQPRYNIELGTGSGITALYQAAALSPDRPLHSVEGSPRLAEIAAYNAQQCGLTDRMVLHQGSFENVLPQLLQSLPTVDYAFVDGNHGFDPTMAYFEQLMAHAHENTILVFDDINWSEEMKRAWAVIKNDSRVSLSIDIFALGIIFLRQGQEKEHFIIRY